ncbi:hypothetical protein [Duganella sp. Root1480D1]|uniref:hypothetical protein n=1 Tax=Duganella sp. Root1480D1 TaxID=1736471 RepID=UPI000709259E|nr:hypothetical protein [Duganella sp. Root1480D1]KQZ45042.1 hypothetical protein ASD58_01965 [Duganella sp. Root1480D1]
MQLAGLIFWLAGFLLIGKIINFLFKRPVFNPWAWFGGTYVVLYVLGILAGAVNGNPNLAYLAGYQLPLVIVAASLGIWRAPKWREAEDRKQSEQNA